VLNTGINLYPRKNEEMKYVNKNQLSRRGQKGKEVERFAYPDQLVDAK
jgi:hypothetical protein